MNRLIKKIIAVIIVLTMVFSIFIPNFSALAQDKISCPTVYICGQGYGLNKQAGNSNSESIYPLDLGKDFIMDTIHNLNPAFLKALITGDYTDYCNVIYDAVSAKFQPLLLDKNGEASDGSGSWWTWNVDDLTSEAKNRNGNYGLFDYMLRYDWRLDPCDVAVTLNNYINDILTATGSDKVNLVSRCLGCNIVAAYFVDYGYEKVNKCVFYASAVEGLDVCNDAFSDRIGLEPDSLERYAYDNLDCFIDDDTISEFVKTTISVMNKTYGLDLTVDFMNNVLKKVESTLVPRLLRATYGTMPSYLSMTNTASYEEIKKVVFGGLETEYAGTIAKSDNYHYNVQNHIREILKDASKAVDFMVIGKYGYQIIPVIDSSDEIADGFLELSSSTFGATTARTVNDVFSDEYMNAAKQKGTDKYISIDKQVDLSTCLFPDSTWVIKHIEHKNFPSCIDSLICTFLSFEGQMTVNDCAEYPQYMIYDDDTNSILPMNESNKNITNWNSDSFITLIYKFISQAIPIIMNLMSGLVKGIK